MISENAIMKAAELPVALVTTEDIFSKPDLLFSTLTLLVLIESVTHLKNR